MLLGRYTVFTFLQPQNNSSSIMVTPCGIVIEVRLKQPQYLQLVVYQFVLIKTVEK